MFKFVIVVLALIASALAVPKPVLLAAAPSYSYTERFDKPALSYYSAPLPSYYYNAAPAPYLHTPLAYSAPAAAYPAGYALL
ncbi:hypothetical protein pipiens_014200 [Culex pipiens pipiens]|uniref:Cuticle protein n=1 Tax=Culex pipiens pipiens TaxID=38569 RepID=A0ABD1CVI4_CULPP